MTTAREKHLTTLLTGAGLVTVGKLVGSFTTLGERVLIGRVLSPEAYGEVSVGLALLAFATTGALVGFSQGVPRYISRFDDEVDRRGVWVSGILVTGAVALVLTAVLLLSVEWLTETLLARADSPAMLALFVLALPFVVGMKITVAAIRGHNNAIYRIYAQDLTYPLTRIVLLVALLFAGFNVLAAGYAYLVAAVLSFAVSLVLLHRLTALRGEVRTHVKEIGRFSLPIVISGVLTVLLTRTDTLMLSYFRTTYEVGQYAAAYPIANGLIIVISSFGFLYLPLASRLDADDEHDEIDSIYETTTKWIYLVTFPALLTFVLFGGDVVEIFFGSAYSEAPIALAILSVGFFTNAVGGRNRETISALGVTSYLLVVNGAAFGINVVLNLWLIPEYGLVGAAVASAIAYGILNATACAILWRKYGITPFSRWSVRTFLVLPLTLLPPAYVVSQYVSLSIVTLLPWLVAVGLLSIAVVALTGCLQPEDEIVLEFLEQTTGVEIPLVRRFIPPEE
ncbi:membrane protein involved in the export of O-antigen and teichoic acid [Salinarchaeum sp. Harcht-Bsk1]|uniref:flippase n=1 Tax=Salinarchaeum sp. Harcht-Bsk1 TaxID=1333523 RepID=UPI00034242DC|nr:flippase [Salinarchaeum sp. Harcht-Bsk1]AGN00967.1 membrane protein involved in the export of O-antigen and teichoic acid [Salinarchaeum sp. Harcht-Bsk1]